MDNCIFCSIVNKHSPAYIVYEDELVLAFLDQRPVFLGHTLVVTKIHRTTFYDIPSKNLQNFFSTIQMLGRSIEIATESEGSFIAINNRVSQSVPHIHTHIIPRKKKDGLKGFFWPRQKVGIDAMQKIKIQIQAAIINS